MDWLDRWEFSGGLSSGGTPISGFRFALEGSMPLAEQQEPRWDGSWPKVGAREVQRGIWLADRRGERQEFWLGPGCGGGLGPPLPGPHSFLPGPQERPLLGAGSAVVSCLLEGPVRLGPGSVLQHCHLQVRPGVRCGNPLWGAPGLR